MVSLRSIVVFTLLCATVGAIGVRHPPHDEDHHDHHDYHHDHHGHHGQYEHDTPIPAEEDNTNTHEDITRVKYFQGFNNINFLLNIMEDRKFYKPYFYRPYPFYPYHHHPQQEGDEDDSVEGSAEENNEDDAQPYEVDVEVESKHEYVLLEYELDENNSDIKEELATKVQESESNSNEIIPVGDVESQKRKESFEVPCDFITVPKYSCYSCYTYLVCKQSGGKVKACKDPYTPYCNDGLCTATPSSECQANMSATFQNTITNTR